MLKKTILTSKWHLKHLFTGQNTQQLAIRQRIKAKNLQILQNWSLGQKSKNSAICYSHFFYISSWIQMPKQNPRLKL